MASSMRSLSKHLGQRSKKPVTSCFTARELLLKKNESFLDALIGFYQCDEKIEAEFSNIYPVEDLTDTSVKFLFINGMGRIWWREVYCGPAYLPTDKSAAAQKWRKHMKAWSRNNRWRAVPADARIVFLYR